MTAATHRFIRLDPGVVLAVIDDLHRASTTRLPARNRFMLQRLDESAVTVLLGLR
jgi:hypothetical protein